MRLLPAAVSFALLAAPSMAADLAVTAPVYKAPPPVYFYSWTGCYVGGNGGGMWVQKDFTLTGSPPVPLGLPVPGLPSLVGLPVPIGFGGHDVNSGVAGVQVGCNYQFAGGWVIGIQGDFDWANATGSHIDPVINITTVSSSTKSLASVTGRIGYAWDRFLGYVKGGGAWERDDYSWINTTFGTFAFTGSETRGGWTVGVGGEYAFLDWLTGFFEFDYYDFGTRNVSMTGAVIGVPNTVFFNIHEKKSVVKAGLNFKFGGAPVVAKY
jgi:outer membrane immunogenic protein